MESKRLTKIRVLKMKKLKITAEGLERLMLSEKMETIEELTLDNGGHAFPSFYESEHCGKL